MVNLSAIYGNTLSTFGGLKTATTKKQGGFDSAGESVRILGNNKGYRAPKKANASGHLSLAEEACDILNQKYQR